MTVPNPRSGEPFPYDHHNISGQVDEIVGAAIPGIREDIEKTAVDLATILSQLREIDPHRESYAHQYLSIVRNMVVNALGWVDRTEGAIDRDDETPPPSIPNQEP